jgi:hypothetical protein
MMRWRGAGVDLESLSSACSRPNTVPNYQAGEGRGNARAERAWLGSRKPAGGLLELGADAPPLLHPFFFRDLSWTPGLSVSSFSNLVCNIPSMRVCS